MNLFTLTGQLPCIVINNPQQKQSLPYLATALHSYGNNCWWGTAIEFNGGEVSQVVGYAFQISLSGYQNTCNFNFCNN